MTDLVFIRKLQKTREAPEKQLTFVTILQSWGHGPVWFAQCRWLWGYTDEGGSSLPTLLIYIQSFKISWVFLAFEWDQGIQFLSRFPEDHGDCSKITLTPEIALNWISRLMWQRWNCSFSICHPWLIWTGLKVFLWTQWKNKKDIKDMYVNTPYVVCI